MTHYVKFSPRSLNKQYLLYNLQAHSQPTLKQNFTFLDMATADSSGRALWGVGLRPFAFRDCGFESRWGHWFCLLWMLCVVMYRSLRWANHSSREVLPSVACLCVIEELQWGRLGPLGLSRYGKKGITTKNETLWLQAFSLIKHHVNYTKEKLWLHGNVTSHDYATELLRHTTINLTFRMWRQIM